MYTSSGRKLAMLLLAAGALGVAGCRDVMPHAFTWPGGGDVIQTHAKPPEGGYYANWDPYAVELQVVPMEAVNPVQTQHVLIATVKDAEGEPLPNRRVEWTISSGSVGDIVEVDESGWRNSRGYKVNSHYAVTHTNNGEHVLDRGNDDPSDDIHLTKGQTWCVITSPIEGDTNIIVYAPGINDWAKHKVFVSKHWYDVQWEFPPPAVNPTGTQHEFVTRVTKASDDSPLEGYVVTYTIVDGPAGAFDNGQTVAAVTTDASGLARVVLRQAQPAEGMNNIEVDIMRPGNDACCLPPVHIATGYTAKTWIGPRIGISKTAPAQKTVNEEFNYAIQVTNPSQVDAHDVVVTDVLPDGIAYVSSTPAAQVSGQQLSWSLGVLGAGANRMIGVTVRGTRQGSFENCATVTAAQGLSDRACARTIIVSPQLVLEKQCTPHVTTCEMIEHTVIVRNTGDGPANNVRIVDELPDGLVTENGRREVIFNAGTLEAGQAKQGRFTVKPERTGTFTNRATATGDGGLTAEAECTVTVVKPELKVTKVAPAERYIGRPAEYEITVENIGDSPASNTVLTDRISPLMDFVSADSGGQLNNGVVTWSLGTLEPGASKRVKLMLKAMRPGTAENTAHARAVCAEAEDSTSVIIKGVPAILLEVIDVDDPIEIGARVTYVITVTNQGSAVGTGVQIICGLPDEERYVSSDGPTTATLEGQQIVFAPLAQLAPGAKATYRVIVTGAAAADVRFKVSLTSEQIDRPVEETESTRIY